MNKPDFLEGVGVALVASIAGGVLQSTLGMALPGNTVLQLLIAAIGLAYILYLLNRSQARIGRVTTVAAWMLLAMLAWFTGPPLLLYLLIHLGAIWLVRSLYFYSSLLPALADLGLIGLGLAAALWSVSHTGSVFLGIWCFFLLQALFSAIPASLQRRLGGAQTPPAAEDRFQQAHRVAEAAVRTLTSIH